MRGRDKRERETRELILTMHRDSNKEKVEGERNDESILIEDAVMMSIGVDSRQVCPISPHRQ